MRTLPCSSPEAMKRDGERATVVGAESLRSAMLGVRMLRMTTELPQVRKFS
eukprot:02057_2